MKTWRVAAAIAAVSVAAACSTDGTPTASDDVAPASNSAPSASATGTSTPTATTPQQATYAFTTTRIVGSTDRVEYDVSIPQLTGGDDRVVAEFDESMRAALQDQIDGFGDQRFTLSDARPGPTYIGPGVVSAVLDTSWDANPPGAHPTYVIATVTVDTATAQPVTLQDLFPDLQAGLQRLSEQSALLLPDTAAGPGFEPSGIAPTPNNFANWTPSAGGMNIRFGDYQVGPHAIGLVDVTVPWSALADVADPQVIDSLGG
ncbi:RsiV family protein [Rhodococcoides yunnanense]|uniref:RsiV family protein n=1 Tax=Rhodococcoides yunnanense TaxID=278209 RepID=UPI000933876B|nr:RsiV family protein [Rhodococcus yunnanensis]